MKDVFKIAPFGVVAWVWTGGFILGLVYFMVRIALHLAGGIPPDTYDVGVGALLVVLIIFAWMRSAKSYRVADDGVTIERAGPGKLRIPLDNIGRVEAKPNVGSFYNLNVLSLGGLFGWWGKVRIRNATDIRADVAEVYGTNANKSVALHLKNGRTVIVTPADPEGFVFALHSRWVEDTMPGERQRASGKKSKRKGR